MLPKDYATNIMRSLYVYLFQKLSANYYVNYSSSTDEKLEKRIKEREASPPYYKWIEINWIRVGQGIFSISLLQINCNSVILNDPYRLELMQMHDETQEELNQDTIPLLDFSNDPDNPIDTGNVLVPRYRGSRSLPNAVGDTVNVEAMDYNVYVWRESVLP